jgi:hypothetical protein
LDTFPGIFCNAHDGYVICTTGCRLGRGYQPPRAFFSFTVIRRRGPERNYPQISEQVTFVTPALPARDSAPGERVHGFE